ncbi:unnamed protein product [Sphagnum compactum]
MTLFLADNKLSCPLPHQLGKLKNFQNLFAGNKQLTDPLPKELGNLPISNQMDISHNDITGLIPSNYGWNVDPDLDISIIDFSNNMLTGPTLLAMQNLRVQSFCPGNPSICSKPLPNNCK